MRTSCSDHITKPHDKWRCICIVKSDVPHFSSTSNPALGTPVQQYLALGGICGRRNPWIDKPPGEKDVNIKDDSPPTLKVITLTSEISLA